VGDFGLSARLYGSNALRADQASEMGRRLNPRWAAPEVLRHEQYSVASDVYAMGVTMWEVMSWQTAFSGQGPAQVKEKVIRGERMAINFSMQTNSLTTMMHALIEACWQQDASKRPDFEKIHAQLRSITSTYLTLSSEQPQPTNDQSTQLQSTSNQSTSNQSKNNLSQSTSASSSNTPISNQITACDQLQQQSFTLSASSTTTSASSSSTPISNQITACALSSERYLWCGYSNGSMMVFDLVKHQPIRSLPMHRHTASVSSIICDDQSSRVWSACRSGSIRVWSAMPIFAQDSINLIQQSSWMHIYEDSLITNLISSRSWLVLESGWLSWFKDQVAGISTGHIDLSCIASVQFDTTTAQIILTTNSGTNYRIKPSSLTQISIESWYHMIGHVLRLMKIANNKKKEEDEKRVLHLDIAHSSTTPIKCLEQLGGHIWSISSQFAVHQWHIEDHGSQHGLHSQLKLVANPAVSLHINIRHEFPNILLPSNKSTHYFENTTIRTCTVDEFTMAVSIQNVLLIVYQPNPDQPPIITDAHANEHQKMIEILELVHNPSSNMIELWSGDLEGTLCIWQFCNMNNKKQKCKIELIAHKKKLVSGAILSMKAIPLKEQVWVSTKYHDVHKVSITNRSFEDDQNITYPSSLTYIFSSTHSHRVGLLSSSNQQLYLLE